MSVGPRPSKEQRTLMRRHVMRDIGYSRRKSKGGSASGRPPVKGARNCAHPCLRETSSGSISDTDQERLSDPSIPSSPNPPLVGPIVLDYDSQRVLMHMFSDGLPGAMRIYRDRWYPLCVTDPIAFHQMLASYALHLDLWRQGPRDRLEPFSLYHHCKALSAVRAQLLELDRPALGDVLLAVSTLACHAHLVGDLVAWRIHTSAIKSILADRSPVLSKLNPSLLSLLQWVDSIGSYSFDLYPTLHVYTSVEPITRALYGGRPGSVGRPYGNRQAGPPSYAAFPSYTMSLYALGQK
ncbi:predicted protein [Uncinocarpus reesii 1704]|uniref:Uncharacterized protein n=1 Tax=Uncinocarpus reesii (strain UAMH 1704) TaxID=336963 RepID=C4JD70_UNCRE|nr:uncharacterized protein UREG_00275 [Uncinocarpus reesii 1704]EEP75429.1 predicted protein [Uncinocarpus reesii 1704]